MKTIDATLKQVLKKKSKKKINIDQKRYDRHCRLIFIRYTHSIPFCYALSKTKKTEKVV